LLLPLLLCLFALLRPRRRTGLCLLALRLLALLGVLARLRLDWLPLLGLGRLPLLRPFALLSAGRDAGLGLFALSLLAALGFLAGANLDLLTLLIACPGLDLLRLCGTRPGGEPALLGVGAALRLRLLAVGGLHLLPVSDLHLPAGGTLCLRPVAGLGNSTVVRRHGLGLTAHLADTLLLGDRLLAACPADCCRPVLPLDTLERGSLAVGLAQLALLKPRFASLL
jgi:hypothetical protein